jgi:hypothetical protein
VRASRLAVTSLWEEVVPCTYFPRFSAATSSPNLNRHSLPCCCNSFSTLHCRDTIPPCARTHTSQSSRPPLADTALNLFGIINNNTALAEVVCVSHSLLLRCYLSLDSSSGSVEEHREAAPLVVFQPSRLPIQFASHSPPYTITQHPSSLPALDLRSRLCA